MVFAKGLLANGKSVVQQVGCFLIFVLLHNKKKRLLEPKLLNKALLNTHYLITVYKSQNIQHGSNVGMVVARSLFEVL